MLPKKIYMRLDDSGKGIPGSAKWATVPPKNGRWVEVTYDGCCNDTTTTSTTTTTTTTA